MSRASAAIVAAKSANSDKSGVGMVGMVIVAHPGETDLPLAGVFSPTKTDHSRGLVNDFKMRRDFLNVA